MAKTPERRGIRKKQCEEQPSEHLGMKGGGGGTPGTGTDFWFF